MKRYLPSYIMLAICLFWPIMSYCAERVKEPAVAGTFYPADTVELRSSVRRMLADAQFSEEKGRLLALISPHAGYIYSGHVAAHTYRHLKERDIDTVILIGASHHKAYKGASVYVTGSMKTPLGNVKIDEKLARSLIDESRHVTFMADAFEKEHSIEVQLPFLQETLHDFKIVPLLIDSPTQESFMFLVVKLTSILRQNPKAIIIASTDLSHYHDSKTASVKDMKVIESIKRIGIEQAGQLLRLGEGEMCGGYPVLITMAVARNLGASYGKLYKYANSGDVTSDRTSVVGYAAMGLYKAVFTEREKKELLELARNAITNHLKGQRKAETIPDDQRLSSNGATFVTIKRNGQLRGCIGNIMPIMSLYRSIVTNAVSAASRDPRFPPMAEAELKDMEVELTILSPLEPIDNLKDIIVGKHGLYLTNGNTSSVFLPQVPVEQHWDLNAYLENLALKAGLPKDGWKNSLLYTFTADIISE